MEIKVFEPYFVNEHVAREREAFAEMASLSLADILAHAESPFLFFKFASANRPDWLTNISKSSNLDVTHKHCVESAIFQVRFSPLKMRGQDFRVALFHNVSSVVQLQQKRGYEEYKNLIVRSMSHEQLTPLNSMLSTTQTLRTRVTDPELEKIYSQLWCSSKLLDFHIKSHLSELCHAGSSAKPLSFESVSSARLRALISEVVEPFQVKIDIRRLTVEIEEP